MPIPNNKIKVVMVFKKQTLFYLATLSCLPKKETLLPNILTCTAQKKCLVYCMYFFNINLIYIHIQICICLIYCYLSLLIQGTTMEEIMVDQWRSVHLERRKVKKEQDDKLTESEKGEVCSE